MRDLIDELIRRIEAGLPCALCRLVETRGSTPQKAGAAMLIFPDGAQRGTLGGGCVEAEVKRRALAVMDSGTCAIERFQLDDDYGWDDGLICGGRMTVLVESIKSEGSDGYFHKLRDMLSTGAGATTAVVFDAEAAALPAGATCLFDEHNQCLALRNASGTDVVFRVQSGLRPLQERPRPYCQQGISYLTNLPRCRLVIVGGGHVGQAVGHLAAGLDFDVWVVDDRAEYVSEVRFPLAKKRLSGDIHQVLPNLEITPDTYCLIVTRGHNHDEEALWHLANRGARYVGMIGSKRKIRLIFDDLREKGVPAEVLEQVYAPIGIEIGSQTVEEIAVSIAAELVAHRNLGVVPGKTVKNVAGLFA